MSYHVKRVRAADPRAAPETDAASQVGQARYSRRLWTRAQAQREADAWNRDGDFGQYWPSSWTAEVRPGRPPRHQRRDADREAGS